MINLLIFVVTFIIVVTLLWYILNTTTEISISLNKPPNNHTKQCTSLNGCFGWAVNAFKCGPNDGNRINKCSVHNEHTDLNLIPNGLVKNNVYNQ